MKITLIKGAYVIDPTNNVDAIRDILIQDGYIVEVAQEIDSQPNYLVIDATGLIATPGLIDFHLHGYQYATKLGSQHFLLSLHSFYSQISFKDLQSS